jgi:toxin CcdB
MLATHLTMPLAEPDALAKVPTMLCPVIVVKGKLLRRRIDNVAVQGSALVSAMDVALSGV